MSAQAHQVATSTKRRRGPSGDSNKSYEHEGVHHHRHRNPHLEGADERNKDAIG